MTNQYGAYTASPAKKTTAAIVEVKIVKSLQFQVNRWSISRDTSVEAQPKIHLKILNFHSFHNPVTENAQKKAPWLIARRMSLTLHLLLFEQSM